MLTAAIFAKIFMTYINTTLIPSLGEISFEEMTMSLASTIYATDKNGNQVVLQTLFDNTEESGGGNRELIEYKDLPLPLSGPGGAGRPEAGGGYSHRKVYPPCHFIVYHGLSTLKRWKNPRNSSLF